MNTNTAVGLSATATAWHDYDLQTDHYAVAFLSDGGYFENPLYFGNSCDEASGDCSVDGGGDFPYLVTAEFIYIGSTVADQGYVPQDASMPPFDLNAYNGFLASAQPPYTDTPSVLGPILDWSKRISTVFVPIKLLQGVYDPNKPSQFPPIPFYVELKDEGFDLGIAERQRTFLIKDLNGRLWDMNFPLSIRERFSNIVRGIGGVAPQPDGIWYNKIPQPSAQAVKFYDSEFKDHHRGTPLNAAAQVSYLQYYYATDFIVPSYLGNSIPSFTLPGIFSGTALPFWIRDTKNKCSTTPDILAEGITLSGPHVYINGGNGPGTGCRTQ